MLPKNGGSIDVRRRQIDTLKIFNDKYVRVSVEHFRLFLCCFCFCAFHCVLLIQMMMAMTHSNILLFCSVTEIKVGEEYSVGFVTDGRQAVLKVFLGPKFPNEKPKIVVNPLMQHDWIPDPKTGLIQSAPGLLNVCIFNF